MDYYLGGVLMFAGNFEILGFAYCNGQLMSIAQNTALFSIIGTTYGGDGQVTFALPDLRGRVPLNQGQGPGLPYYSIGEASGYPTQTLLTPNMPAHNHTLTISMHAAVSDQNSNSEEAAGSVLCNTNGNQIFNTAGTGGLNLGGVSATGTIGITGNNSPFSIMPPYLTITYLIALEGIFPSRN